MSPHALRRLETSLVSAFVSFGVSAAVLHAADRPQPTVSQACTSEDPLSPLLHAAVEADAAFGSRDSARGSLDAFRVEGMYVQYVEGHETIAGGSMVDWAQKRIAALRQYQEDLETMGRLKAQAEALEAARARGE